MSKQEVKDNIKISVPSTWKDGTAICRHGDDVGAAGLGTRNSFDLMNIRLEMSGGFIDLGGWAPLRLG